MTIPKFLLLRTAFCFLCLHFQKMHSGALKATSFLLTNYGNSGTIYQDTGLCLQNICRTQGERKMRMGRYNGRGSIVSGAISFIAAVVMIFIGVTAFNAGVPNVFMLVFLIFAALFIYDGVRNIKGAIERRNYEKEQDEISFSEELRRSHRYDQPNSYQGAQRRDERQHHGGRKHVVLHIVRITSDNDIDDVDKQERASDHDRLPHFESVDACVNVDAVRAENAQHYDVNVVPPV